MHPGSTTFTTQGSCRQCTHSYAPGQGDNGGSSSASQWEQDCPWKLPKDLIPEIQSSKGKCEWRPNLSRRPPHLGCTPPESKAKDVDVAYLSGWGECSWSTQRGKSGILSRSCNAKQWAVALYARSPTAVVPTPMLNSWCCQADTHTGNMKNETAQAPQSGVNTDAQQFCPISIPLVPSSTRQHPEQCHTADLPACPDLFLKTTCFTKAQLCCEESDTMFRRWMQ